MTYLVSLTLEVEADCEASAVFEFDHIVETQILGREQYEVSIWDDKAQELVNDVLLGD